jgi:MYXO-CTERM domain-containing protein
VIADEDDCSAFDDTVFDPSQTEITDPLGRFSSFRCTEYGVACDGAQVPRAAGMYTTCEPFAASPYIYDPQVYVDHFTSLKSDPSMVVVGVIAGDVSPFVVELNNDPDPYPELQFSCGTPQTGSLAMPAVRLKWFADQFDYNTFQSICANDFASQITFIGSTVRAAIENGSDDRPSPSSGGGCSVSTSPSSSASAALAFLAAFALLVAVRVISRTRRP